MYCPICQRNWPLGQRYCGSCGQPLQEAPVLGEDGLPRGWTVFHTWGSDEDLTNPFGFQTSMEEALNIQNNVTPYPSKSSHFMGYVSMTADRKVHVMEWYSMHWDADAKQWVVGDQLQDLPADFSPSTLERNGGGGMPG